MRENTNYRNRMDKLLLLKDEDSNPDEKEVRNHYDKKTHKVQNLYSNLIKIDYSQDWNSQLGSFDCEQTFTWLDWNLAYNIKNRTGLPFSDLTQDEQYRLIYSIFHEGVTLLHMLS